MKFDFFGAPLPSFNMSGTKVIHTKTGGLLSFCMFVLLLIYASLKLIQLFDRDNPNVSEFLEPNVFNFNDKLDLNKIGFRLAFSVEGFLDQQVKDDPKYVKYIVRLFGFKDGKRVEYPVPFHKCTESDWALFPPASSDSIDIWSSVKDDPDRNMYCIDWDGDRSIFGNERNVNFRALDIEFVPCNYLHSKDGSYPDSVTDECEWN